MDRYASRRIRLLVARLIVLSISGSVGFFGLGPAIEIGLHDLERWSGSSGLVSTIFAAMMAVIADAAFVRAVQRRGNRDDSTYFAKRHALIFSVSLVSAIVMLLVFDWGAANQDSWRFAEQLETEPGISKHIRSDSGTQIATLNLSHHEAREIDLASLPVLGRLRVTGGKAKVAYRTAQVGSAQLRSDCSAAPATSIVELTGANAVALEVAFSSICSDWQVYDVDIPPDAALVRFRLEQELSGLTALELANLGVFANRPVFWAVCAAGALLIIMASTLILLFDSGNRWTTSNKGGATESNKTKYFDRKELLWGAIAIIVFLFAANLSVSSYVSREKTIYAWDFGGHWMVAANLTKSLAEKIGVTDREVITSNINSKEKSQANSRDLADPLDSPGAAEALLRNVRYAEYNATSAIPLALPMIVWGPARLTYELSMVNVYALFSVIALILALSAVWGRTLERVPTYWIAIPALIVLFFNPFWVPLLRGYIGVSIVGINTLVLWLYFRKPLDQQRIPIAVLVALLLVIGVIFRRWNAYWVVSFFAIMIVDGAASLIRQNRFDLKSLVSTFRFPFITGLFAMGILCTVAWPLVVTMLTTDYSDIYAAYAEHAGSFSAHVEHFIRAFGVILIALVAVSAVYLAYLEKYRRFAALLVGQVAIMVIHFSSTQTMGPHHFYILMPAAFLLLGTAATHALGQAGNISRTIAVVAVVAYLANGVLSHVAVFSPAGEVVRQALVPLVPDNRRLPLVRGDLKEIERIAAYLDEAVSEMPGSASIYVLASSTVISVAQLRMLEISTGFAFDSADRLLRTSAVDKRDGFPTELLRADLVLVTDPVQFNRGAEFQQVIQIPHEQIQSKIGVGRAFDKLPAEFRLDGDVRVYVYRRIRENSDDEVAELSQSLRKLYPDRPEIYSY